MVEAASEKKEPGEKKKKILLQCYVIPVLIIGSQEFLQSKTLSHYT
jgi:hypothetical protein